MTDASFCAALLQHPGIAALVANRIGLAQLKQGWPLPALVYQVISSTARPYLAGHAAPGPHTLRMQINPLAMTVDAVDAINAAVRSALLQAHQADGVRIVHVEPAVQGPYDKDPTTGAWTRPADYLITVEI